MQFERHLLVSMCHASQELMLGPPNPRLEAACGLPRVHPSAAQAAAAAGARAGAPARASGNRAGGAAGGRGPGAACPQHWQDSPARGRGGWRWTTHPGPQPRDWRLRCRAGCAAARLLRATRAARARGGQKGHMTGAVCPCWLLLAPCHPTARCRLIAGRGPCLPLPRQLLLLVLLLLGPGFLLPPCRALPLRPLQHLPQQLLLQLQQRQHRAAQRDGPWSSTCGSSVCAERVRHYCATQRLPPGMQLAGCSSAAGAQPAAPSTHLEAVQLVGDGHVDLRQRLGLRLKGVQDVLRQRGSKITPIGTHLSAFEQPALKAGKQGAPSCHTLSL